MLTLFAHAFIISLGAMFPMINPLGHAPIFYSMTSDNSLEERRKTSWRVSWYVLLVLLISLFIGKYVLQFFSLTINDIRVGGGLLVAVTGFKMLENVTKLTKEEHAAALEKEDIAFSPMAMPILAGPGAMSLAIGLTSYGETIIDYAGYVAGFIAIAFLTLLSFYFADYFATHLKTNLIGALNRILGFLLLAIGVNLMVLGIKNLFFLHV